jgi:hypothetical protein
VPKKYLYKGWGRAQWSTHAIPALGRMRQEDLEFKASLGYRVTRREGLRKGGKEGRKGRQKE